MGLTPDLNSLREDKKKVGCKVKQGIYKCGDIIGKDKDCIILCDKCSEEKNGR